MLGVWGVCCQYSVYILCGIGCVRYCCYIISLCAVVEMVSYASRWSFICVIFRDVDGSEFSFISRGNHSDVVF